MQPTRTHITILSSTQRQTLNYYRFRRSYLAKSTFKPTKSAGLSGHSPQRIRGSAKRICRGAICEETGFSQCLNLTAWAKALRISMYNSRYKSIRIPVLFETAHATAEREVLIDSGATDNFICKNLLQRLKIATLPLEVPLKIWNVDGTHNQDGKITHFTDLQVRTGTDTKILRFLLTNLGRDEVILGYPWLTAFEPLIHWKDATLDKQYQPVVISSIKPGEIRISSAITEDEWAVMNEDPEEVPYLAIRRIHSCVREPDRVDQEVSSETESKEMTLRRTTMASELAQLAMDKTKRTYEEMVPEEYRKYQKIFNEEQSHRFPPKRPWDHAIDLLPEAPSTIDCKIYPTTQSEKEALSEFVKEQLAKGYIRPSKSPYSSPFFFIKKKDGKLRPVQDYRRLNSLTVKNRYPLPLIPELIDQVRHARR